MYICKSCGSVFSQPAYTKRGYASCPDCGSKKIDEAEQCPICHEYFIPQPSWRDYCDECLHDAEEQLRQAVDKMVDKDYVGVLCEEYTDLEFIIKGNEDG